MSSGEARYRGFAAVTQSHRGKVREALRVFHL